MWRCCTCVLVVLCSEVLLHTPRVVDQTWRCRYECASCNTLDWLLACVKCVLGTFSHTHTPCYITHHTHTHPSQSSTITSSEGGTSQPTGGHTTKPRFQHQQHCVQLHSACPLKLVVRGGGGALAVQAMATQQHATCNINTPATARTLNEHAVPGTQSE